MIPGHSWHLSRDGIVKLLGRCGAARIGRCGDCGKIQGYRYPIEIIGHAVWLYHRFALTLRDVEELMLARGVAITYQTIRSWCATLEPDYANKLLPRGTVTTISKCYARV